MRLVVRIEREHLTATETERLIRTGRDRHPRKAAGTRGRPRKHVRIKTRFGGVLLTPNASDFDDDVLLAMMREARSYIVD